ncbi:MAG: winged helix-turn-helix transcriptional regulator [Endomicrobiia bacterium]
MQTQQLTEKEINIISQIYQNPQVDQRTIAQNVGLSLGLTNLIIKKLIKTGYIKIKQLNKRKVQYILTAKGFAEKTKKSYNYILKTVNLFKTINSNIQQLILKYLNKGIKKFIILGKSELAQIVENSFKQLSKTKRIDYRIIKNSVDVNKLYKEDTVIFFTDTKKPNGILKDKFQDNFVRVLDYLCDLGISL